MKEYERPTAVMCKPIPGYEQYLVFEDGRVYSTKRNKFLKQAYNNKGYLYVPLCDKGVSTNVLIHRLVAGAFIANPDNLDAVHHKDGNPENNNVSNLVWMSKEEHTAMHKNASKRVRNLDTGEVYESAVDASVALGYNQRNQVAVNIRRGTKCKGYNFEFVKED